MLNRIKNNQLISKLSNIDSLLELLPSYSLSVADSLIDSIASIIDESLSEPSSFYFWSSVLCILEFLIRFTLKLMGEVISDARGDTPIWASFINGIITFLGPSEVNLLVIGVFRLLAKFS